MISAADELVVAWLPTDAIEYGDDQAPVNPEQVAFYVELMRPGGHVAPPLVSRAGPGRWRLRDGKHRHAAHVALGRTLTRCIVITPHPHGPDICTSGDQRVG